jgi:excisionase family DNA binding protein
MQPVAEGETMATPTIMAPDSVKTFLASKKGGASALPTHATAKQLPATFQVTESTIYEWVHLGYIPHIRLGCCVRFNLAEVQAWLQEHTKPGRTRRVPEVEV